MAGKRLDANGVGMNYYNEWESNAWSRFELVHCRDGKARRFEPESFPLVDGFPKRLDLLRGYGNAIVPQVAAEFIKAFLEAEGEITK